MNIDSTAPRNEPVVSIIMPAYNAEKYISHAVDSARAQSYSDWELVIVDDGSTDRTPQILAGYADARIRVYHQPNSGESAARNAALDHARGKYLSFLDADDVFLPNHVENAIDYFQTHPECDGLYCDGWYIKEDGMRLKPLSARRRGPFEGDIFEQVMRSSDVFGAPLCIFLSLQEISRRQICFDSQIIIGPDWDFLIRYAEKANFGYSSAKTCLYRVHTTNISITTGSDKRNLSLARCREKAIRMARFDECSDEVRAFVFYDLLINLLRGKFQRQAGILEWPEFQALPRAERARLLRLMASDALMSPDGRRFASDWLRLARMVNPADHKATLLEWLFHLTPGLCGFLLSIRKGRKLEGTTTSPFADLFPS